MKEYKARIADKILAEKLDAMGAVLNFIRELSECRENVYPALADVYSPMPDVRPPMPYFHPPLADRKYLGRKVPFLLLLSQHIVLGYLAFWLIAE